MRKIPYFEVSQLLIKPHKLQQKLFVHFVYK